MQAIEVLRDVGKLADRPVYALAGEDLYLRREATQAIIERVLGAGADDFSVHAVRGDEAELSAVLDELRTLPFLSPRRVVIVEEGDGFVTKYRKELEAYSEQPVSTGVLILQLKSFPGTTRLAKIVSQKGLIIECKGAEGRGLLPWLHMLARRLHGHELEAEAADLLLDLVGPEPGLLATEVEKLAVAVGPERAIGREDVARLVGGGRVEEVWKAIEAAATGQRAQALVHLDALLSSGEPPVKLLGAITYSLMRVHHSGQLRMSGVEAREACRRAGVFPGAVERVLQQHKHLGPKRVGELPARLLKADLDLKGNSAHAPRVVLEALFTELAQPRKD